MMDHGGPKHLSEVDRKRQQAGARRKELVKVVRRVAKAWRDSSDAETCMREIDAAIKKADNS